MLIRKYALSIALQPLDTRRRPRVLSSPPLATIAQVTEPKGNLSGLDTSRRSRSQDSRWYEPTSRDLGHSGYVVSLNPAVEAARWVVRGLAGCTSLPSEQTKYINQPQEVKSLARTQPHRACGRLFSTSVARLYWLSIKLYER